MSEKTFLKRKTGFLKRLKTPSLRKSNRIVTPAGTDWVGYETIIEFIRANDILSVAGDMVEIGTFLGGGACKMSKFLETALSTKKLYVVDVFDPTFDWTRNTDGNPMGSLYCRALEKYGGKTQEEVFFEETRGCKNIIVLKGDSKRLTIPIQNLCFGFVDGNHAPEYVENDFYLIWNKLTPKGAMAFHDYRGDLPDVTSKIEQLLKKHSLQIQKTLHVQANNLLFIVKND